MLPAASVDLSIPIDKSRVRSALPVILLISLFRNALRAEFMEKAPVLPSARYMPVVSIVTASFPRCSVPMACNSPCISISSGASRVNSRPMSLSVFVIFTPQSNVTLRPTPLAPDTVALVRSVAAIFSAGFMGSPVNSIYEPS